METDDADDASRHDASMQRLVDEDGADDESQHDR